MPGSRGIALDARFCRVLAFVAFFAMEVLVFCGGLENIFQEVRLKVMFHYKESFLNSMRLKIF